VGLVVTCDWRLQLRGARRQDRCRQRARAGGGWSSSDPNPPNRVCVADVRRRAVVVRACVQQWLRKLKPPLKLQAVNPFSIFCDWQTQPRVPSAATPAPSDSSPCAPERRVRYGAARRASVLRFTRVRRSHSARAAAHCVSAARSSVTGSASGVVGKAGGEGPRVARSDATLHAVAAEVNVIAAGVVEPNL
jgi:hypothetical protein